MAKNSTVVRAAQPSSNETATLDKATLAALEELQANLDEQDKASAGDRANPEFWTGSIDQVEVDRLKTLSQDDGDQYDYLLSEEQLRQSEYKQLFKKGLVVPLNDADPHKQQGEYHGYRCGMTGVFYISPELDKDKMPTGRSQVAPITQAKIMPVEVIEAKEDDGKSITYVKLLYKKGGIPGFCELTMPYAAVINPLMFRGDIRELLESGIEEKELKRMGPHMRDLIEQGVERGLIKVIVGRNRTGWFQDQHLRAGRPGYAGAAPVVTAKAGDAKVWHDTVVDMIENSPMAGIAMAVAMASYVRGKIPLKFSNLVHFYGEKGTGKSSIVQMAQSLHGYPDVGGTGTFLSAGSTDIGLERFCASVHHGTMALDELHLWFTNHPYDAVVKLVGLLNGGGRIKANKSGDAVHTGFSWNITMMSTGNTDIVEKYGKSAGHIGAALDDRSIEINIMQHRVFNFPYKLDGSPTINGRDSVRVSNYLHTLCSHYGHGYEPVIDYISQNESLLEKQYEYWHGQYEERLMSFARKAQGFALIRVGIDIMSAVLELDKKVVEAVVSKLEVLLSEISGRIQQNDDEAELNVSSDLVGFVNANLKHFVVNGCLWPEMAGINQSSAAMEHTARVKSTQDVWGYINQKGAMQGPGEFNEIIGFNATGVSEAKRRNVDVHEYAQLAKKLGFLSLTASTMDRLNKKVAGFGWCHEFDIGKALQMANSSAAATVATANPIQTSNVAPAPKFTPQSIRPQEKSAADLALEQDLDRTIDSVLVDQ